MKGSKKSRWVAVLVVAIVAGTAYWFWQGREAANSTSVTAAGPGQQGPGRGPRHGRFGAALAAVQAATATSESVPRYLSGLGTVTAANTVTVRSRVDGQLLAIHFTEGQQVKAGDLLAEIDPSQFKVAPRPCSGPAGKRSGHHGQRSSRFGALPAIGQNQPVSRRAGYSTIAGQRISGHD